MKYGIFCISLFLSTLAHADYILDQAKMDADIQKELSQKQYTVEDPLVLVNPYGISPLSALISFSTQESTQACITVKGKDKYTTFSKCFNDRTKNHLIPVYGLYFGKNDIVLTIKDKNQSKEYPLEIETEKMPINMKVNIQKINAEKIKPGLTFTTPGVIVNEGSYAYAFDANGDIRWILTDPIMGKMSPLHVLNDGTLMMGSEEHDPKYTVAYKSLYELDLMGKIHHKIQAEDDIQHDIVKLPNGNYLALVNATGKPTIADCVVELTPDNKVVDRFDIDKILGVEDERITPLVDHYLYHDNYKREKMDAMHLNSLNYDPEDDSIIMTGRFFNFLLKIDRKTKQVKWILANPINTWIKPHLRDKLLKPTDKNFDYIYGAHAAKPQGHNHYTVLDNGLYRDIYDQGSAQPIEAYNPSRSWSRGVEFVVDEKNMTVSVAWQYKRGPEIYTHYVGDVDKYEAGHYLMNFGAVFDDKDETPASVETALNPQKQPAPSYAKIIEVKNGEVVFEAQTAGLLNNTVYRVERFEPYVLDTEYKLGK